MSRITIWIIILALFSSGFNYLNAQDAHFSQFINNPLYYNPAYAGLENGLNINLSYRRLWPKVPGRLENYFVSLNKSLWIMPGFGGLGLIASSDVEGEGNLRTTSVSIPISSKIQLSESWIIQVAIMASYTNINIDWSQFVFGDQLNPIQGAIYSTSFIPPDINSKNIFDLGTGGFVKYESNPGQGTLKFNRIARIGFSAFHVNHPNLSFTGQDAFLPVKYVIFGDFTFPLTQDFYRRRITQISPGVLFEYQKPMYSYMAGINFIRPAYEIGLWYRNKDYKIKHFDSLILGVAYLIELNELENSILKISYSYDLTLSDLSDASGGAHEIMLNLAFGDFKLFNNEVCKEEPWKMKKLKKQINK